MGSTAAHQKVPEVDRSRRIGDLRARALGRLEEGAQQAIGGMA